MQAPSPHFLLFSEASGSTHDSGRWGFVLQSVGGDDCISAGDLEPNTRSSRLELLAVVRGLEALDQPSRVTLLTGSRYVSRGIRHGLNQWRDRGWQWERFGVLVPIRDCDLWRRLDRALSIHTVDCCESHVKVASVAVMPTATVAAASKISTEEPALVIVPRRERKQSRAWRGGEWTIAGMLNLLRDHILAPWTPTDRPAFTRAA